MIRSLRVGMMLAALALGGGCAMLGSAPADEAAPSAASRTQEWTAARQLERFLIWFPGEYNNNEQVWAQKEVAAGKPIAEPILHLHHLVLPVEVPKLGNNVFLVRQTVGGKTEDLYRLHLYRVGTNPAGDGLRMEIYGFRDIARYADAHRDPAVLKNVDLPELTHIPGCEILWRFDSTNQRFHGAMADGACRFQSDRGGVEVRVSDERTLVAEGMSIRDSALSADGERVFGRNDGQAYENRKVRYYLGWAAMQREGRDPTPGGEKWRAFRDIALHNEGQTLKLTWADGSPTGYSLQLAQLTYQGSQTPVLTLKLLDDATGKSVSYAWANPDATRIGLNIGWFQAGLVRKSEDIHFGPR